MIDRSDTDLILVKRSQPGLSVLPRDTNGNKVLSVSPGRPYLGSNLKLLHDQPRALTTELPPPSFLFALRVPHRKPLFQGLGQNRGLTAVEHVELVRSTLNAVVLHGKRAEKTGSLQRSRDVIWDVITFGDGVYSWDFSCVCFKSLNR